MLILSKKKNIRKCAGHVLISKSVFISSDPRSRSNFENIVILGNFNIDPTNSVKTTFMADSNFVNIIKSSIFQNTKWKMCWLNFNAYTKTFLGTGMIAGASDHRLLIFSFLKTTFTKISPNRICHIDYITFHVADFLSGISDLPDKRNYKECKNQFVRVFNKHALLESKIIRDNNKAFLTKTVRKAIMRRSASKKKVDNSNGPLARKLGNKQRTYVVNLSLRKTTFRNIVTSKNFWKFSKLFLHSKPFFSKTPTFFEDKIILVEKRR